MPRSVFVEETRATLPSSFRKKAAELRDDFGAGELRAGGKAKTTE